MGKKTTGMIALSSLLAAGYIIIMLAAAEADSDILHFLGYALLAPSMI